MSRTATSSSKRPRKPPEPPLPKAEGPVPPGGAFRPGGERRQRQPAPSNLFSLRISNRLVANDRFELGIGRCYRNGTFGRNWQVQADCHPGWGDGRLRGQARRKQMGCGGGKVRHVFLRCPLRHVIFGARLPNRAPLTVSSLPARPVAKGGAAARSMHDPDWNRLLKCRFFAPRYPPGLTGFSLSDTPVGRAMNIA